VEKTQIEVCVACARWRAATRGSYPRGGDCQRDRAKSGFKRGTEDRMRAVVQRVLNASVSVGGRTVGEIEQGLLVLVGFAEGDGRDEMEWMAAKVRGLRIFSDSEGRMNLDVGQVGGAMLVVSQFTLYGDVSRGRRPSFVGAAEPDEARRLYDEFVEVCRGGVVPVATGEFGARMEVSLLNDGPVTLVVER
jgi:D-tyrosyl-tRNA(Tyr) deacylase